MINFRLLGVAYDALHEDEEEQGTVTPVLRLCARATPPNLRPAYLPV